MSTGELERVTKQMTKMHASLYTDQTAAGVSEL